MFSPPIPPEPALFIPPIPPVPVMPPIPAAPLVLLVPPVPLVLLEPPVPLVLVVLVDVPVDVLEELMPPVPLVPDELDEPAEGLSFSSSQPAESEHNFGFSITSGIQLRSHAHVDPGSQRTPIQSVRIVIGR